MPRPGNQPAGPAYFRKVIEIPAGRQVTQATFLIAADDAFTLYINGHDSGNGSSWKTPASLDVPAGCNPAATPWASRSPTAARRPRRPA